VPKKILLLALCFLLLALGFSAEAQPLKKVPRIGFLDRSTASGGALFIDAFRHELTRLSQLEG
jgi:hypothetical protein